MPLLSEIDGWTPVIDEMAKERGLVSAAVFGVVWRHCQMKDRVCDATLETMADKIGVDRATILRHIKKLCADGYLKDMTPGLRNAPHTYADTGKMALKGEIRAAKTVAQRNATVAHSNVEDKTVAHSNKSVAQRNATVAHSNKSVAESYLRRHETFKETGETEETPPPAFSQSFEELAKKALTVYSDTTQMKLDKTQAAAITDLIKAEPEFNFTRWVAACTSVKLGGVKPENVQCRIDTYRAGGNYQAMISAKRNGGAPDAPAPKVSLRGIDPAAYKAQLEVDRAAAAESAARVERIIDRPDHVGVNVEKEMRRKAKKS